MVTKPAIQTSADLNRALAEKENQEKQKADAAAAAKARSDGPPNKKAKTDEVGFHEKHDMSSIVKTLQYVTNDKLTDFAWNKLITYSWKDSF